MINYFFNSSINQKIKELSSFIIVICLFGLTIIIVNLYGNFKNEQIKNLENVIQNTYFQKTLISISKSLEPRFEKYSYKINAGETFEGILEEINLDIKERKKVLNFIAKNKIKLKLYKNQKISFEIDNLDKRKITKIVIPITKKKRSDYFQ